MQVLPPACGAILAQAVPSCPTCGHAIQRPSASEITGTDPGELVKIGPRQLARLRCMAYGEVLSTAKTFDALRLIGIVRGYKPGWPYKFAPELGIPIPGRDVQT